MPLPEDSRPFTVLRQHVDDFKSGFDDDIKSCLDLLDSKLSSLMRDPIPAKTPPKDGSMLSVDIQFTRAKYDIYVNMKNLFDELESSWKEQLEEMRKSFLENVEILLAKTKLDEKVITYDAKKTAKNRRGRNESPSADMSLSPLGFLAKAKQLPGSMLSSLLPQSNETCEDIEENGFSMDESKSRGQFRNSPIQSLKAPAKRTPSPKKLQVQNIEDIRQSSIMEQDSDEEEEEEEVKMQEVVSARGRQNKARNSSLVKQTPTKKTPVAVLTPQKRSTRGRKSILKTDSLIESGTNEEMECEETDLEVVPRTPKNVHFSVGLNVNEDLEIYSPEINITRSAPRRKTVITDVAENFNDVSLTPNIARAKSKRKTMGSIMDNVPVAPSPKRFKSSRNASVNVIAEEDDDLSRSESSSASQYTPWVLLDDLDGKVPTQPGVYELKVYKAKKTAYIGSCDNIRHKLTLHKLAQNSGHKHLDKYLERNKKDIQVRYEIMPSAAQAKDEEKKRIKSFVEQYRSTPSYN